MDDLKASELNPQNMTFTGKGSEFFRIWIVNIALTICTLGIYSAWAKVRTNRYFYNHTRLAGSHFDFLATPQQILRGRIIAVGLLGVYAGINYFMPSWSWLAMLILAAVMPMLLVLALGFRMRNTAFKNIKFHFRRDFSKAYLLAAAPVALMIAMVLSANNMERNLQEIQADNEAIAEQAELQHLNSEHGHVDHLEVDQEIPWSDDISLEERAYMEEREESHSHGEVELTPEQKARLEQQGELAMRYGIVMLIFMLTFPLWEFLFVAFMGNHAQFGTTPFSFKGTVLSIYGLYLKFTLMIIALSIVVGVIVAIASAVGFSAFSPEQASNSLTQGGIFLWFFILFFLAVQLLVIATLNAWRLNWRVSNLHLGEHQFEGVLSAYGLAKVYLINTITILLTLGLAIPWAKVRTHQYKVENMFLHPASDLNEFMSQQEQQRSAIGEEVDDIFDLDLGF